MSWPEADITIDETTLTIRLAGLTTTQPAHTLDAARHAATRLPKRHIARSI